MGCKLIPLAFRAKAHEFLKYQKGKRILTFNEVTPASVAPLDRTKPN